MKQIHGGIVINDATVNCLLYADDLALISDSEEHMQELLNVVSSWSRKWRIKFNQAKSKVVHFRKSIVPRSNFMFQLCSENIEIVEQYKYLGSMLHESLDFQITANVLAKSAQRAMGAVTHKYRQLNGLSYTTYTTLFNSCVATILDYGAEVWGYKDFTKIDTVQQNAIRVFLGLHKFAPVDGFAGDMGWTQARVRRHVAMVRFWNRMISMDDDRLTKKIFLYDLSLLHNNWSSEMKCILESIDERECFDNLHICSIHTVWPKLH